jgi:hypothetical protein
MCLNTIYLPGEEMETNYDLQLLSNAVTGTEQE